MVDVTTTINAIQGPKHLLKQLYDGEDKGIHSMRIGLMNLILLANNM